MIEKRGVIDEHTPCQEGDGCKGEPHTKEAADRVERHPVNDMIDAVAEQSERNRK